jgi:uncharacterized membrane protein YphA (DoxX/SURF4 family)
MAIGERLAVSVAPLFLRLGLGVTFLWAGMGKFVEKVQVQGEDAAILANAGVIKPQWTSPAPTPAGAPAPGVPAATTPPPAPTQPLPPTGEQPKEPPKDTKAAPKANMPAPGSMSMGAASPSVIVSARYQPSGVIQPYTAKEFPEKMEVPRVHFVTLTLIKGAVSSPGADGKPRMALVPEFAARGNWPVTFAYAAAVAESLGGAFLLVGLFTRLSALALAWTIGVAAWLTVIGPAVQNGNTVCGFIPNYPRYDLGAWQKIGRAHV